jgi:cell division septal protein FtsQ
MFTKAHNRPRDERQREAAAENAPFRGRAPVGLELDAPGAVGKPSAAAQRKVRIDLNPLTPKQRAEMVARRKRRGFAVLGLMAAVATVGVVTQTAIDETVLKNPDHFLRCVKVHTDGTLLSEEEIEEATEIKKGDNVLLVDLAHVKAKLQRLPALSHVTVSRDMEGRILVVANQRRPVAWVQCEAQHASPSYPGGGMLVDADGTAIPTAVIPTQFSSLPVIQHETLEKIHPGEVLRGEQFSAAMQLMFAMQERRQPLVRVVVHRTFALDAVLKDGPVVTFAWDDLEAELPRFDRLMHEASIRKWPLATLNVINERNFGVTFKQTPGRAERPAAAIPVMTDPTAGSGGSARRT